MVSHCAYGAVPTNNQQGISVFRSKMAFKLILELITPLCKMPTKRAIRSLHNVSVLQCVICYLHKLLTNVRLLSIDKQKVLTVVLNFPQVNEHYPCSLNYLKVFEAIKLESWTMPRMLVMKKVRFRCQFKTAWNLTSKCIWGFYFLFIFGIWKPRKEPYELYEAVFQCHKRLSAFHWVL